MLSACVGSILFLLRNLAPAIVAAAKDQAIVLMGGIAMIQFILTLTLKLAFFSHS